MNWWQIALVALVILVAANTLADVISPDISEDDDE